MSLFLLCDQYTVCFVLFIWMVCEMGGKWSYNNYLVGCCFQDVFKKIFQVFP